MAYSSHSPNEERFGFSAKGGFHIAYENERVITVTAVIIILSVFVLAVILFFVAYNMLSTPANVDTVVNRDYQNIFAFDVVEYGITSIAVVALITIGVLGLLAFCIVVGFLRAGIRCEYKANVNYMEIIEHGKYPRTIVIFYNDVVNVTATERKFLFARGLDVTIQTKKKTFLFRYIHNHLSKIGGLSETPFNIICERAELVSKPKYMP